MKRIHEQAEQVAKEMQMIAGIGEKIKNDTH